MAALEPRLVLQTDELLEACELFSEWAARRHRLPAHLRDELVAIASLETDELAEVRQVGPFVIEAVLSTRARVLVANLRAQHREASAWP